MGPYKNGGREWRPSGDPQRSRSTISSTAPSARPTRTGCTTWVQHRVGVVGTDHDTAAFAVNTIATWWRNAGKILHRKLPAADLRGRGGSTGTAPAVEDQLAELAPPTGLTITVCHLPSGTSKWNKIEDRLFSTSR